ncbi:MAG: chlorite dismutase family protein [Bryobacteraceae bacterium]|nr:chlorite dismutase family protein [Bryobacteraceae bacterium]
MTSANQRLFTFIGGQSGVWSVTGLKAIVGDPLPAADRIDIINGPVPTMPEGALWRLVGATSNERYVDRSEKAALVSKQLSLGRPEAKYGALIPIRKNPKWWSLSQEERRTIFESQSHHTEIGLKYLPAVARRLHHCRDLSESQPFDFLTLFDFAKEHASAFDELVAALRESEEWKFVDRELDIRLQRA